jgi:hypothetical protein
MYTGLRPKYSLKGAKAMGPKARPSTYKLNPNVPASDETPKVISIPFLAGGKDPDAAQDTLKSISISAITIDHFRHSAQFLGFDGSFGSNASSESDSEGGGRSKAGDGLLAGLDVKAGLESSGLGRLDAIVPSLEMDQILWTKGYSSAFEAQRSFFSLYLEEVTVADMLLHVESNIGDGRGKELVKLCSARSCLDRH